MTFSVAIHHDSDTDMRVDVAGCVLGAAAIDLQLLITEVILLERPDTLVINLHDVTALSIAGMHALLTGYATAIDYGTSYRVLHASGQARYVLRATGTLDMLADSDDLGALLLAVLARPVSGAPS
ncbi:STAS domain-containing protein [Amycolatopsis sp. NBC_01480]|uniref:STAS domain-containing protein n=1 Tax=Amycolatopsis sp. NBC_01480 TaxID=2903562 RepID=UPI002E29F4CC|nr:STAS domain-containing protein [Amycolatopsis sp. NBC_01480]